MRGGVAEGLRTARGDAAFPAAKRMKPSVAQIALCSASRPAAILVGGRVSLAAMRFGRTSQCPHFPRNQPPFSQTTAHLWQPCSLAARPCVLACPMQPAASLAGGRPHLWQPCTLAAHPSHFRCTQHAAAARHVCSQALSQRGLCVLETSDVAPPNCCEPPRPAGDCPPTLSTLIHHGSACPLPRRAAG